METNELETPPSSTSNPPSQTSESQQTQQTNHQLANPTNQKDPYVELLEGTIAEQNRKFNELNQQLAGIRESQNRPAPIQRSEEELRTAFFNNPHEETGKIIEEKLRETINPIKEMFMQFQGQTQIDRLIDQFKNNPRFSSKWNPSLEAYIKQQAQSMPPAQLTEQNFTLLVLSTIGAAETGMLPGYQAPAPPAPTQNNNRPTDTVSPPHLRPTSSPMPSLNPKPTHRELTEGERRLYREYNAKNPDKPFKSEEHFLKWMDMPRDEVAFATFDQPKS